MTFDEAWEAHKRRQNIIPPNQQTFRHGWNSALEAAAEMFKRDDSQRYGWTADHKAIAQGILALEVEVQT